VSDTDTTEETTAVDNTVDDPPADDADVGQTPTTEAAETANEDQADDADTYAKRLHLELVRANRKLADPTDLELNEEHLDDLDALAAAVDDLLACKPHLASRRPTGDIGQGASPPAASSVDLAALLRQRAR
jgi:hypothetical protein